MSEIEISQAKFLPFFQENQDILDRKRIELVIPLIIRDELVGVVLLGEKANGEAFTEIRPRNRLRDGAAHRRRHRAAQSDGGARTQAPTKTASFTTICG